MTSKTSSSKKPTNASAKQNSRQNLFDFALIMTTFKKNLWLPTLALIGFFFALPVATALTLQRTIKTVTQNLEGLSAAELSHSIQSTIIQVLNVNQTLSMILVVVGSLLAAIVIFRYLHNRKQVDFYHSLPLKRKKLFITNYLAGFLIFLIPYAIGSLLNIAVIGAFGYLPHLHGAAYLSNIAQNVLFFLALYSTGVLAMLLSGNLFGVLKISAIFLGIGPFCVLLFSLITNMFYPTFYKSLFNELTWCAYTSPLGRYLTTQHFDLLMKPWDYLILIAFIAVITCLAFICYKKRASEAAGQTLAFKHSKLFFKVPLALLGSAFIGLFFYNIGENKAMWLFFGIICSSLIICQILEIACAADFKAIKKAKLEFVIITAVTCLLLGGAAADITGFNLYLPAADKVASINIKMHNIDAYADAPEYNSYSHNLFGNAEDVANLKKVTLTQQNSLNAAIRLAESAVYQGSDTNENPQMTVKMTEFKKDSIQPETFTTGFTILYTLKNGKEVARYYDYLAIDDTQKANLVTIINDEAYKKGKFTLTNVEPEKLIAYAIGGSRNDSNSTNLTQLSLAEQKEFGQIYLKELKNRQVKTQGNSGAISSILFRVYENTPTDLTQVFNDSPRLTNEQSSYDKFYTLEYPIYSDFTETIAFLEQKLGKNIITPNLSQIKEVLACKRLDSDENSATKPTSTISDENESCTPITNPAEILNILKTTYPENQYNDGCLVQLDTSTRYQITYKNFNQTSTYKLK